MFIHISHIWLRNLFIRQIKHTSLTYLYSLSHTDSKYKTCQSVNRSRNLELTFFIMKKQAAQNQFIYTGRNNEIVQIVLQRNYP